ITTNVAKERLSTHGRVDVGSGWHHSSHVIILECQITYGSVSRAMNVFKERVVTNSVVVVSVSVVKQRKGAETIVEVCTCDVIAVIDQRVSSVGPVLGAAAVEQKRRGTTRRIGISEVEDQRSATKTGVETAGGIGSERIPANCCVSSARG